jgi:hypothetical protein
MECPNKNAIEKKDCCVKKAELLRVQAEKQVEQQDNDLTIDDASATVVHSTRVGWIGLLIAEALQKRVTTTTINKWDPD